MSPPALLVLVLVPIQPTRVIDGLSSADVRVSLGRLTMLNLRARLAQIIDILRMDTLSPEVGQVFMRRTLSQNSDNSSQRDRSQTDRSHRRPRDQVSYSHLPSLPPPMTHLLSQRVLVLQPRSSTLHAIGAMTLVVGTKSSINSEKARKDLRWVLTIAYIV